MPSRAVRKNYWARFARASRVHFGNRLPVEEQADGPLVRVIPVGAVCRAPGAKSAFPLIRIFLLFVVESTVLSERKVPPGVLPFTTKFSGFATGAKVMLFSVM